MSNKEKPDESSPLELVDTEEPETQQQDSAKSIQSANFTDEKRSGIPRRVGDDRRDMIRFEDDRREGKERRDDGSSWDTL